MRIAATAIFALAVCARAQPGIRQNGVVNSASRIPPTLPGGAIARGAQFTIYGVRLGSPGHTHVTVSSGENSAEAHLFSVRAGQIEGEMPTSAPVGAATLAVSVDGQASAPFPIEVANQNPGLFSRNDAGWGPGRIQNITAAGRSDNSAANPTRPGQHVVLSGTGFGNVASIMIVVGQRLVKLRRRSALQGEEKIEFEVPRDAPEGCYVPVYVLASPIRASNVVTMSIRSSPGPCRPGPVPLLDSEAIGVGIVSRTRVNSRNENIDSVDDAAAVTFASKEKRPLSSPLLLLPPPGTCTAYTGSFQADVALPNSIPAALMSLLAGHGLDAGSQLTIAGNVQSRSVIRENSVPGYYRARLGQAGPAASRRAPPLFLDPGELTLAGPGGKDVGAFRVRFSAPVPFEWTDRDSLTVIDRKNPLSVHWNAPKGQVIIILATNVDQLTTAIGTSLCVVRSEASAFSIPPAILANIPASRGLSGIPYDQLYLSSIPAGPPQNIQATGLETSAVLSIYTVGRFVQYR